MTKYSKIKKSSFAILALSLILVAVLAFGGTYAYFSSTTGAMTGSVTTGTLKLTGGTTSLAIVETEDSLVPNQTVTLDTTGIKLQGNTISALRMNLSVTKIVKSDSTEVKTGLDDLIELDIDVAVSGANWLQDGTTSTYYYNKAVVGGSTATAETALDATISLKLKSTVGNEYQGATIHYSLTIEATQAEYHESIGEGAPVTTETVWASAEAVKAFFTADYTAAQ